MDESLEVTAENLRQKYLVENLRLQDMAKVFGMPVGTLRKHLAKHKIKKTQKQAGQNTKNSLLSTYGEDYYSSRLKSYHTPESKSRGHENSVKSRHENMRLKYESEGITYAFLHEKYIKENLSMIAIGDILGKTKSQVRKALIFFEIRKPHELYEESRQNALQKVYADPHRVEEITTKTKKTIRERYGDDWYYKNPSKLELEVLAFVSSLLPKSIKTRNGERSVISQPRRGGALELDIYIPELKLAIEVNGDYYHDRKAYEADVENGTCFSREREKDVLCSELDIKLIHVWEKDWRKNRGTVCADLEKAIGQMLNP